MMRRRDLIKALKDNSKRLRSVNNSAMLSSDPETLQAKFDKRHALLNELELLAPEILRHFTERS